MNNNNNNIICAACDSSCDEGLEWCFGDELNECCSFYQDDECVTECDDGSSPDEDEAYTCPNSEV